MDTMNQIFEWMEESPWALALFVLLANVGFNLLEDDEKKEHIFKINSARIVIIFSMIFCYTKSIKVSLISTCLYIIVLFCMRRSGLHKAVLAWLDKRKHLLEPKDEEHEEPTGFKIPLDAKETENWR